MARNAKLSKITVKGITYWTTKAGGKRVYFGSVKEVARKDAETAFLNHRKAAIERPRAVVAAGVTVKQLLDEYLEWVQANLSQNNFASKKSCLGQWANHRVGDGGQEQSKRLPGYGKRVGEMIAERVTQAHLADFLTARKKEPARPGTSATQIATIMSRLSIDNRPEMVNANKANQSALMEIDGLGLRIARRILAKRPFGSLAKLETAIAGDGEPVTPTMLSALMVHIKACWNWGRGHELLPETCHPFARVAKIKIPKRPKHESELLTKEEYAALLRWADFDLGRIRGEDGRYRGRRPEECRKGRENPYSGFGDLLKCFYAIGPRTSEPATILVRDVNLRKGQVVLGLHKRSATAADGRPRVLTLTAEALEIFRRSCQGKKSTDYVFTQGNGSPWNQDRLDERFAKVRSLAGIREEVTLYSFRHLWITDALESGVTVAEVAEMAGTSIKQIEETYGHVRSETKSHAQELVAAHRARQAS